MKKKTFSLIAAFFILVSSYGQNIIEEHFSHLKDNDNYTTISISSKMFEMAGYIEIDEEDEDTEELQEFLASVSAFNMIIGNKQEEAMSLYNNGVSKVNRSHEELMSINNKEGNFSFYIDETKGIVRELVMVGMSEDNFMVFSLIGDMDLRQIGKMSQKIQAKGFQEFSWIEDHKAADFKVYPNPVNAETNLTVNVPKDMIGQEAQIFSVDGATAKNVILNQAETVINMRDYPQGNYIIKVQKGDVVLKRKFIVIR